MAAHTQTAAVMPPLTRGLAIFRIVSGLTGWISPHPAFTVLGVDVRGSVAARYMGQLYGARELALGVLTLTAKESAARQQALTLGIAVDGGDTISNLLALRSGQLPRAGRAAVVATTLALAALGRNALMAERRAA